MEEALLQDGITEEEDTQKDLYLIFNLGEEAFGVDIKIVSEMIGIQPIAELPEMPECIRGIINLRGKIIPVMDVRLRFKKPLKDYDWRTCIIVIDIDDLVIGLIVDSVDEVLKIPKDNIVLPTRITQSGNGYIKGIGKSGENVKMLIDCFKLVQEAIVVN
jgi:purine-binding chemotaxis protein CheW